MYFGEKCVLVLLKFLVSDRVSQRGHRLSRIHSVEEHPLLESAKSAFLASGMGMLYPFMLQS